MKPRIATILAFVLFGLFSRFLPHPPNCTAINAIALFSIATLGNPRAAFLATFLTMFISDLAIGLHSTMLFVYMSLGMIVYMGHRFATSLTSGLSLLPMSSLIFFVVTNFGEWLVGSLYPKTVSGLGICYLAALPFLGTQMMGDLMFGGILATLLTLANGRYLYVHAHDSGDLI